MAASNDSRFALFDVVVVPFALCRPASRRNAAPALVISNRKLAVHGLVWVAMITSADNEPWSSDVPIADLKRARTARSIHRSAGKDRMHRGPDRSPHRAAR